MEAYDVANVKSISQNASSINGGLQSNFSCDTFLYSTIPTGFFTDDSFTITSIGVVACAGRLFNSFKVGDIFAYQKPSGTLVTFNRVTAISADDLSMTVEAVADVPNVVDGALPSGTIDVTGRLMISQIFNQEKSYLYSELEETNIAKVGLSDSTLTYSRQVTGLNIDSNGTLTINSSALNVPNSSFAAYDQNRYSIFLSNGTPLNIDSTAVTVDPSVIQFHNLIPSQSNVTVNVTAIKSGIRSKTKITVRSEELIVDRISTGIGTDRYSLQPSPYYGLRVDDEEISLNVP